MGASISTTGNVKVGPIANDWTVRLEAIPHSPLQSNGSTGEIGFSIPAYDRSHLLMNNPVTFNYVEQADSSAQTDTLIGGTTYSANNPTFFTGLPGVIDSVNISGGKADCTMGTPFTQFATTDIEIPWVGSGVALAALDLAYQLAGNQRCTLASPKGYYWSLAGHDTGFDLNNKLIYAEDHSYYVVDPYVPAKVFRMWDMRSAYFSHQWNNGALIGLNSYRGEGSSPSIAAGTRTSIAFRFDPSTPNGTDLTMNFGSNVAGYDDTLNGYAQQYGFGPWNTSTTMPNGGTGKVASWGITRSTKLGSAYITYNSIASGSWVQTTVNPTFDLSTLDFTKAWKVVTDIAYPSSTSFSMSIWIKAADGTGPTVTWSSGTLGNTTTDLYAKPWDHIGGISGLYQVVSPMSFDPSTLLANYETPMPVDTSGLGNQFGLSINGAYPVSEPIAPYTGSLWDYLCQVFTAKQTDLRIGANGKFYVSDMSIQPAQIVEWTPTVAPSVAIDNSNTATTVEIDAQLMDLNYQPTVYDARLDGNQVYSIAAGQSTTFTINGDFTGSVLYNPCPIGNGQNPQGNYAAMDPAGRFGAFIISGADDLPIVATQWAAGGGRVYLKQTGPSTVEVTVICPDIVTANGDGGNNPGTLPSYYFGISDGQNQYGCLQVVSGAGSRIIAKTLTYQTGASYTAGNSSPGAVSNPCATNMRMVNTLAGWASSIATGPNMVLTATIPTADVALQAIGKVIADSFGQLPGKRLLYRNIAWRIMSATLHSGGIDVTCEANISYGSNEWNSNWGTQTVDQYTAYWAGCTYDDLNTMPIAGPLYNWSNTGTLPPTVTALGIAQDVEE